MLKMSLNGLLQFELLQFGRFFVATLDVFADLLICNYLRDKFEIFSEEGGSHLVYGYFFFTAVSLIVYVFEMIDICKTLKYDEENLFYARLVKSLILVCEEVPLPLILYNLMDYRGGITLAHSFGLLSMIKIVTLAWGFIKFIKMRFFWPCLPLNPKHETRENVRRCFTLTQYRISMVIVNIFHVIALTLCILCVKKARGIQTLGSGGTN
ncbi:unnamed protein product [Caenorhabditis angaria]|uniref:Uncharacterized protein n=1 Tax=Caenorhabditis angaria TaxID=860376 RepID=A0A9P1J4A0_9PELO|nr:unnamed protein product [Caenorhabditis angaria]